MSSEERLVIETFDQQASRYAKAYHETTSIAHSFNIRRQRVYEMLSLEAPAKILDIGCGPGITIEDLSRRGFEVFGVDISKEMIRECQAKFAHIPRARFSVGRIEKLEFSDNFFDAVICMGVVEYIEDDSKAVREMVRVVKPGGCVIITLPNQRSPYRIWDKNFYRPFYHFVSNLVKKLRQKCIEPRIAHREYKETEYSQLLQSCGLKTVDVVYYNFKLILSPLDEWFARITILTSRKLESLCRSRWRWLGTSFIVKALKSLPLREPNNIPELDFERVDGYSKPR